MASITIRNMDEALKAKLRIRAAHRGRSMEDEARNILRTALSVKRQTPKNLVQSIRKRFVPLGLHFITNIAGDRHRLKYPHNQFVE